MRSAFFVLGVAAAALFALFISGRRAIKRVETVDVATIDAAPGAKFAQTRSGRIHCLDAGTGPAVLLIHGSGRSIADWREGVFELLTRRHRVVAFDCYGFGFSDRSPSYTYGYDLWIHQAVDLLDALGIEHVTVVGHSVGGALACMLAAYYPSRVDHVVTIGTGMSIEPQQFVPAVPGLGELLIATQTMFGPATSPANGAMLEAAYRIKGTRQALLMYIRRQMTIDGVRLLRGVFEDIDAPVLHVSGARDKNIRPEVARRLSLRTGGRFVLVPGASHSVHTDAPARLVDVIEEFVASPLAATRLTPRPDGC